MLDWLAVLLVRDDLHAGHAASSVQEVSDGTFHNSCRIRWLLYFSFDLMTHELMPHLQYRRFSCRSMGFIKTCGFSIEEWFT